MNTINSTFGHSALPFLERPLTEHASAIPLAWKNHGAYEAELLRRADQRLAAYPSSYGHDFSGPPPLFRRVVDYGTYLRPPWARRFSYRIQHRMRRYAASSLYLTQPYVAAVLPHGLQIMSKLFRMEKIVDAAHLARILSLEYLSQQFASRVCDDFRTSAVRVHCATDETATAASGKHASAMLTSVDRLMPHTAGI